MHVTKLDNRGSTVLFDALLPFWIAYWDTVFCACATLTSCVCVRVSQTNDVMDYVILCKQEKLCQVDFYVTLDVYVLSCLAVSKDDCFFKTQTTFISAVWRTNSVLMASNYMRWYLMNYISSAHSSVVTLHPCTSLTSVMASTISWR